MSADGHKQSRQEIERQLLDDVTTPATARSNRARAIAVFVGILVLLCAALFYLSRDNPGAIAPPQATTAGSNSQPMQATIESLTQRLVKNPEDGEGWATLARTYVRFGRPPEAISAYATAASLLPHDAQLLADYAYALAATQGKSLRGEPEKIIGRALEADPKNVKALALSGGAAFEKEEFEIAVAQWRQLLALIPPESDMARRAGGSIKQAQDLAAASGKAPKAGKVREATNGARQAAAPLRAERPAESAYKVNVTIELSPALAAKLAPQDTLFMFATLAEGSNHPLAIMRRQAGTFPARFTLDDTMAVMPNARLSGAQRFIVGAHISKPGVAAPRSGDLQGFSPPVTKGTQGIVVLIDREVP